MGEPCTWHMKARGHIADIAGFEKMMFNAELNGKGPEEFRPGRMTDKEMHEYGYGIEWDGMWPLDAREAEEYFKRGYTVLRLYDDDTEGEVFDLDDLRDHAARGGIFGIEKESLYNGFMTEIHGCAYDEYPEIHRIEDNGDGTTSIEIYGTSKYSIEAMTSCPADKGQVLLQDAARTHHVIIEVFGNTWVTWGQADMHMLIGDGGTILQYEEKASMHEYLDTFEDEEEALECASDALEELGHEATMENLRKFIDKEGYIDISPFEWDFAI